MIDRHAVGIAIAIVIVLLIILLIYVAFRAFGVKASSEKERERLKLLASQNKGNKDAETDKKIIESLNKVMEPVSEVVSLIYRPKNTYLLERKLKTAGWSDYFTPFTWTAFTVLLGAVGLLLGFLFWGESKPFAIMIGGALTIAPTFLLNNSYNNRKDAVLISFPETIRIITGYLSGGLILVDAVKAAAASAAPIWREFLMHFCDIADAESTEKALDYLKDECDIPEGKEFFATVRLTMDLGGSVREGFLRQAESIDELLEMAIQKKIEKRKVIATVLQAPIFFCILGSVGLPVISSVIDLFAS